MRVHLLTDLPALEAVAAEWMGLYRAHGRSPFQNPELHRIWWERVGQREGWTPLVAVACQDGKMVGVASLAIRRSRMLRTLEWAGTAAFDYPEMLLAPGIDPAPIWAKIRRNGRYDIARLRWLRTDAAGRQPLLNFAHKLGEGHPIHAIDLAHRDGQAWLASLPASMRAEHRDKLRQMAKRGLVAMRRVTEPADIADTIRSLVRFKAEWSQSQGTETIYLTNGITSYFEDVALAAARDGTLHLTALESGGQTLAAHLGFTSEDGFYYYVSAYDIAQAKLSPGRVHMNMMVMWAIDNGLRRFDFLRGEADYKTRLGSVSRQLEDYIFSKGLIGGATLQAYLWQQHRRPARIDRSHAAAPVPALEKAHA